MKKFILLMVCTCFATLSFISCSDSDKDKVPEELTEYFGDQTLTFIKITILRRFNGSTGKKKNTRSHSIVTERWKENALTTK